MEIFRNQPKDVTLTSVLTLNGGFDSCIAKLTSAAVRHTLDDGRLMENGGMCSNGYDWENVPRAVVRDGEGELELVVDAYKRGTALGGNGVRGPPAFITIYSSEPERAAAVLKGIGCIQ